MRYRITYLEHSPKPETTRNEDTEKDQNETDGFKVTATNGTEYVIPNELGQPLKELVERAGTVEEDVCFLSEQNEQTRSTKTQR